MTWWKTLSRREDEVALLVARGLSNKQVARELGISDGTVKIHMHSIFQKLGTKSRYSLIIRSPHWLKVKYLKAPAVKREAEEDWGRAGGANALERCLPGRRCRTIGHSGGG